MKDNFEFEIGFMYHMRNHEYLNFYANTVKQLKEAEFERPMMRECIEVVEKHVELLEVVVWRERKHETSDSISDLHSRRRGMLKSLRDLIDGSHNRETAEQREAAKLLTFWIHDIRDDIRSRNLDGETHAVSVLKARAFSDEKYLNALSELSLDRMFDVLLQVNSKIMALENMRTMDVANRPNTKYQRRQSYNNLKYTLNMLNALIMLGGEDEVRAIKLSRDLTEHIVEMRRLYRFRKSINLNKKEREELKRLEEKHGFDKESDEDEDNGELKTKNAFALRRVGAIIK